MSVPAGMPVVGAAGALGVGALAAGAYWRHMSPYSQACGGFPSRLRTSRRTVALTFDDGPNEPYTSQVAEALARRRVRATFFQVGRCVERHPDTTRRLLASGHVIGNHSHTHAFGRGWRAREVSAEAGRAQEAFADVAGIRPRLYRPPWLIRTGGTLAALAALDLHPVSGRFCHPLEPWQPDPAAIARRTLATVRPGGIVIFHDGYDDVGGDRSSTVAAVELVVDALLVRGYELTTVDRLLGEPAYARLA